MGTYRIQSELNLIDAIPDEAQGIVEAIIDIFDRPGWGVLQLVGIAAYAITGPEYDPDTGRELEWHETSPWDLLVDTDGEGTPAPNTFGSVVVGLLDSAIEAGLDATGEFGAGVRQVVNAINDLFANAQQFTLHGDLVIENDPDAAGQLGDDNEVRYNQLTLQWAGSERTIVLRSGSIIEATDVSGAVVFHPDDVIYPETYSLALSQYDIQLNYGDVLIWIVESIVFPELFGDDINSFDDFFGLIIDCAELETFIEDALGIGGIGAAARTACETFRTVAVDALTSWVRDQTADLGNFFTMGTFADNPCHMGFSSTADEFLVTTLGEESDRCEWNARVRFSEDDEGEPMEGDWFGERL